MRSATEPLAHPGEHRSGSAILVAEDEPRIASLLERVLRSGGFAPTTVSDGPGALDLALTGDYALLILDLGLPGLDGLDVLRRLRAARADIPVIILTARGDVGDLVSGLEGGADDYMTKPIRFAELLARVRLRLRDADRAQETAPVLTAGDLALDLRTRTARVGDHTVDLTRREFTLLELFLRHRGQVLSREQVLSRVWGHDFDPGSNIVDVYVRTLRRKIGSARITTVRGVGYRCS